MIFSVCVNCTSVILHVCDECGHKSDHPAHIPPLVTVQEVHEDTRRGDDKYRREGKAIQRVLTKCLVQQQKQ